MIHVDLRALCCAQSINGAAISHLNFSNMTTGLSWSNDLHFDSLCMAKGQGRKEPNGNSFDVAMDAAALHNDI